MVTRPVARQDSSPDIAHFVSGKLCDLDFDMTSVCVCVCVEGCGVGGNCTVRNSHQTKSGIRFGNNEVLKTKTLTFLKF